MSAVYLHLGQGGVQIAHSFWNITSNEYAEAEEYGAFFKYDQKYERHARCILVDSESKVIQNIVSDKFIPLDKNNYFYEQSGRGNNWAYGYYDLPSKSKSLLAEPPPSLLEKTLQSIRREVEKCDDFRGFIMTHSTSGGTGSGLGSHLIEELRNEYPIHYILSVSVLPYTHGETPLQNYNSVLTLHWLQQYCDCVLTFNNEELMNMLSKSSAFRGSDKVDSYGMYRVSTEDMNYYIASCMAGIFFPMKSVNPLSASKAQSWNLFDFGDLITNVCPTPNLKFVEVAAAPFVSTRRVSYQHKSWKDISTMLKTMSSRYHSNKVSVSLMSQVLVRGDTDGLFYQEWNTIRKQIEKNYPSCSWNPFPLDCKISSVPFLSSQSIPRSLTICSNRNSVVTPFNEILSGAQLKFHAKAYLHWYKRFGMEEDTFQESFEGLANVIDHYKKLWNT